MKKTFGSNNYYQINGWMVNDLMLKGNELIIYAIIYGFSQDGNSYYSGSISYLESATNSSRNTIISCLKSLTNKLYIIRKEVHINGVMFVKYMANKEVLEGSAKIAPVVQKLDGGVVQKLDGGSAKIAPNNTIYNNTINNKEKEKEKFPFENLYCKKNLNECIEIYFSKTYDIARETTMHIIGLDETSIKELAEIFNNHLKSHNTIERIPDEWVKHFANWAKKQDLNELDLKSQKNNSNNDEYIREKLRQRDKKKQELRERFNG